MATVASPVFCARRGTTNTFTKSDRNRINFYNKLTFSYLKPLWICGWNRKKLWCSLVVNHCPLEICLYCYNCTKFGLLILRKIIKIVATTCHFLRLKCTKFDFGERRGREGKEEMGRGGKGRSCKGPRAC